MSKKTLPVKPASGAMPASDRSARLSAATEAASKLEIVIAQQPFELRDDGGVHTKIGDKVIANRGQCIRLSLRDRDCHRCGASLPDARIGEHRAASSYQHPDRMPASIALS